MRTDPAADQTLLALTIAAPNGVTNDPPPNNPDGFLKSGARADLLISVNKPTQLDIAIPPGQLIFLAGNLEFIYRKDGEEKTAFLFTFPEQQVSNFPVNPNSHEYETYVDSVFLTAGDHLFSYKLDSPFTDPDAARPNDGPTVNANLTFTTIPTPTAALGTGLLLLGLSLRRRM